MYQGIESWGGINEHVGWRLCWWLSCPLTGLQGWISVVFFSIVVIIGSFVLLNVFLVSTPSLYSNAVAKCLLVPLTAQPRLLPSSRLTMQRK